MNQINIIGNIFTNDGYASHTRSLANALYPFADVSLLTPRIQNWEGQVNDNELDMITKPEKDKAVNIIVTTPHNWKMYIGLGINCGYCVWEGNKVPDCYIEEFLNPKIDLIFVPSEHTKQAIDNTCESLFLRDKIMKKVRVIPHGVDRNLFYNLHLPKTDNTFKFICNKGWRGTSWDRGGVQYVIKAFAEEFRKDEKVKLIIKLNPVYISPQIINQSIQQLNLPEDRAEIHICSDILPVKDLCELYNQSDVYVCATRAEAFNLPGLEAMGCGLPVIQTNFGGQTDYMTNENSLFIDYDLEEVKEDLMYEEIKWATPRIEHLRKQMRWAFEHKEDIKQMGKQAEEDSKNWTWEISAKKIIDSLSDLKGGKE